MGYSTSKEGYFTAMKNILGSYIFTENTENTENTGSKIAFRTENSTENSLKTENRMRTTENRLRTGLASKMEGVLTLFSLCSHFFQSRLGSKSEFFGKHIRPFIFLEGKLRLR